MSYFGYSKKVLRAIILYPVAVIEILLARLSRQYGNTMFSYRIAQAVYTLSRGHSAIIEDLILGKPNYKRKLTSTSYAAVIAQLLSDGFARIPFTLPVDKFVTELLSYGFTSRVTQEKQALSKIISFPSLFSGRFDAVPEQLYASSSFASLVTSKEIEQILKDTLCDDYVVTSLLVWVSLPCQNIQQRIESAQVFHIDYEFADDIKIFINLSNVNAENGPLEYVGGSHLSINKRIWHLGWSDDSLVEKSYPRPYAKFTGGPGSAYISDNRGIHRDSPPSPLEQFYKIGLQVCASRSLFGAQSIYRQRAIDLDPAWPSYDIWLEQLRQHNSRFSLLFR
jgi:hypothetical protein